MTSTQYRQKSVRQSLNSLFEKAPEGHLSCRLDGLAALISGIVGAKSCQLSKCAEHCAGEAKAPSRTRYLERVVGNKHIDSATYFLPCLLMLIAKATANARAKGRAIYLLIDSTASGSCTTWMLSLVWGKRALPLCWRVLKQKKGHAPQELPCDLLAEVRELLPSDVPIVLLGDGEFDTCLLQATISEYGWFYVLRTAKDLRLESDGESFRFDTLAPAEGETTFWLESVAITKERFLNGINALVWHDRRHNDPLFLLTTLDNAPDAVYAYKQRFLIETLFSDIKSRGFFFHKTRLNDPEKIARLLIAVALAYIWMLWLGKIAQNDPNYRQRLHRTDREDWSCFRFGLALLHELLRTDKPVMVMFTMDS